MKRNTFDNGNCTFQNTNIHFNNSSLQEYVMWLTASSNFEVSRTTSGALDFFLLNIRSVSILLPCRDFTDARDVCECCDATELRRDERPPTANGWRYMDKLAKLKRRPFGIPAADLGRKGELHRSSEEGVTAAESSAKGRGRASMLWWLTKGERSLMPWSRCCLPLRKLNCLPEPRDPRRRGTYGEAGSDRLACGSERHGCVSTYC